MTTPVAPPGWRPGDTAPRDGSPFLAWTAGGYEVCTFCRSTSHTYEDAGGGLFRRSAHTFEFWNNNPPLFWMPLPPPPPGEAVP